VELRDKQGKQERDEGAHGTGMVGVGSAAPAEACAGAGRRRSSGMSDRAEDLAEWRARSLDAQLARRQLALPTAVRAACQAWLSEVAPAGLASAQGVADVPAAWFDTLAWSGMPIADGGTLRWGTDIREADVEAPEVRGKVLLLPQPEALAHLTSLALKPLRLFVATHLGCRLQAAPGIRMWLWPGRAVLLSLSPIPLAGFLYGPTQGHRAGVSIDPWGSQIVTW